MGGWRTMAAMMLLLLGCQGSGKVGGSPTDTPSEACSDADSDGVCDEIDICPDGSDFEDADQDGVPDDCDLCPVDAGDDSDGDGVCDSEDACQGFSDVTDFDGDGVADGCDICPLDPLDDSDGDGSCDSVDVCAGFDDAVDADGDGAPDACDPCPADAPDDTDLDGVCDSTDACPGHDDTVDSDGDGVADGCDPCPADLLDDSDGDGSCDGVDLCAGWDDRVDPDADGVPTGCDPCPADAPDDSDGDGVCDTDDACPGYSDVTDFDGDGVADGCDNCPLDNPDDSDGDGVCDTGDACPGFDDAVDFDGDGAPDACDTCPLDSPDDSDGDGSCDSDDLCPTFDDRIDGDGDGVPNGCDTCPLDALDDSDGDGSCDSDDLCPTFDDRLDLDSDGIPDDCDPDADGDGFETDDCNDFDAAIHPLAGDAFGDGIDADCDGADCDAGFYEGTYFATCEAWTPRLQAETDCQALGYDGLASVLNAGEYAFVLAQGEADWDRWISGDDLGQEGVWQWEHGYPFTFHAWRDGEPNEGGSFGDEDCIAMGRRSHPDPAFAGRWNDAWCPADGATIAGMTCEYRCPLDGDADGDGVCDPNDRCDGVDRVGDLDGDGLCDDVDVDSGLVAYYPLDGSMADLSGNDHHGVEGGTLTYTMDGAVAGAAVFNGTDAVIDTGITDALPSLTVSAWVWLDTGAPDKHPLVDKAVDWRLATEDGAGEPWLASAGLEMSVWSDSGRYGGGLPYAGTAEWVHLTGVIDGSDFRLYEGGVLVDTGTWTGTRLYDPVSVLLGAKNDAAAVYLDGRLDEVRLYDRALSHGEVAVLATLDRCPSSGRTDTDGDGVADACDLCPLDPLDDSDQDGVCDSADLCPGADDTGSGAGVGCPAASCAAILAGGHGTGDGTYWIDPAGTAEEVYCDMTTAGGGWTRVWAAEGMTATQYDSGVVFETRATFGAYGDQNYLGVSFYEVGFTEAYMVDDQTGVPVFSDTPFSAGTVESALTAMEATPQGFNLWRVGTRTGFNLTNGPTNDAMFSVGDARVHLKLNGVEVPDLAYPVTLDYLPDERQLVLDSDYGYAGPRIFGDPLYDIATYGAPVRLTLYVR